VKSHLENDSQAVRCMIDEERKRIKKLIEWCLKATLRSMFVKMSLARLSVTDELLSIFSMMFAFRDQCSSFSRLVYRSTLARMIIVVFILFSKLEFFLRILSSQLNFSLRIVEILVSQNNWDASNSIRDQFVWRSREKNREEWHLSSELVLVISQEIHDTISIAKFLIFFLSSQTNLLNSIVDLLTSHRVIRFLVTSLRL
jgi:hypothetical protein